MRFIDALHALATGGYLQHRADCNVRHKAEPDRTTTCSCGFETMVTTLQATAAARELALQRALEPFAHFAAKHTVEEMRIVGENDAELHLSDCRRAEKTLKDLGLD